MERSAASAQQIYGEALQHHHAGRLREAGQLYQQILDQDPRHADSLHLLGVIAFQTGRPKDAVALIRNALAITDKVALYHSSLGDALKSLGQFDEAAACYGRALALNPKLAVVHNNLGNTLKEQGKLDEAVTHYEMALRLNPALALAHNNLGTVLNEQGKLDAAAASYEQAVRLKPDFAEAHCNLAVVLKDRGKLDEAVTRYERAISLNPKLAVAHSNLSSVLREQGRLEDAVASCERALALNPYYASAHSNLGSALSDLGKLDEAMACYEKALQINPRSAETHYNLGNTLRNEAKLDEAVVHYAQALAIKPHYADAHLNLGNVLKERGKLDKAVEHYEQAIALDPRLAEALFGLGEIMLRRDRPDEARPLFLRALELKPLRKRPGIKRKPDFSALFLKAPRAVNTPSDYLVGRAGYDSYFVTLIADYEYDLALLRASCDVVVNLISDADQCRDILPLVGDLIDRLERPVINHPRKIQTTTREAIAARLAGIRRCRIPKIARLSGSSLVNRTAEALSGFSRPVLVRRSGTHGGDDFEKLADDAAIASFAGRAPDAEYYVSEYVPYESADGYFRKYRLFFADGQILPYHLAISDRWKVHHFRTDMAHQEWMRAEEEAFVADPRTVFDAEHWAALEAIRAAVGLDFFGIDCTRDRHGDLLVFETNASMLVHGERGIFAYKQPYIARIKNAFDAMLARAAV